SKGATSASANVGARWPRRKRTPEAQSLNPRPALSNGVCSGGIANAPSATTGVSFSNSRRLIFLNFLRLMGSDTIQLCKEFTILPQMGFAGRVKVTLALYQARFLRESSCPLLLKGVDSRESRRLQEVCMVGPERFELPT